MKFVFFDLETTGLRVEEDEVIEIGAIKVINWESVSTFKTLVKSTKTLPHFISNLTGITQEDLNKAQDKEDVKKAFSDFIEDAVLVAHNASFDKAFLENFFGEPVKNRVIDTLELARLMFPELQSHSLEKLVSTFKIKSEKAHRAFNDALMLYEVFKKIIEEKKNFPKDDLGKLKRIIGDAREFDFLFADVDIDSLDLIELKRNEPVLTLPFKEVNANQEKKTHYIEGDIGKILSLIDKSGFTLIVFYSEGVKEQIISSFPKLKIFDATGLENFICLHRFFNYLQNPNRIPLDLRMDFAILTSYLIKTKDFLLKNAPNHILKNRVLKNISICNTKNCQLKDKCPLMEKLDLIKDSDVVLTKMSTFLFVYNLFLSLKFDSVIFFEAYRLPKVFYTEKMVYSENDINMIAELDENLKGHLSALFEDPRNSTNSNVLKLFEDDFLNTNMHEKAFDISSKQRSITISEKEPKKIFSNIKNNSNVYFLSNRLTYNGKNILEDFTSLKEELFTKDNGTYKTLEIVPVYIHSPNVDEFFEEFLDSFESLSHIKPALFVFENKVQLKNMKLELAKKYSWIDEAIKNENKIATFASYEFPKIGEYKIVYLFKLPFNVANLSEDYAILYAKNFVLDNINKKEKTVLVYFDGRFKDKRFLSKVNDLFLNVPIFIEKKANLSNFVRKFLES
ncbi:MAG: 3'-5' exoribonuclease [Caldisericaceae bacterium]